LAPVFAGGRVLQFSEDRSAPREAFGTFEVSVYGGPNSLDMAAIDRPDGAYDLVIANHVLEHVADDRAALAELARVGGALFLSVPDLLRVERTVEYGRARDDKHGHYRLYGPDIAERWRAAVPDWRGVGVVAADPVTGAEDRATLLSRDGALLGAARAAMAAAGLTPFEAL
jgi:SAM-dependent methyltransferase